MSTLNNPTNFLRDILLNNQKLSPEQLAETGLDVEVLERTVALMKPRLDYLRGYRSIVQQFKGMDLPWNVLEESNAHTLCLRSWLVLRTLGGTRLKVMVFMSRKGEWYVWESENNKLISMSTARDAVDAIAQLMRESDRLAQATIDGPVVVKSIALDLAKALRSRLILSVDEKERNLDQEKTSLSELKSLLNRF